MKAARIARVKKTDNHRRISSYQPVKKTMKCTPFAKAFVMPAKAGIQDLLKLLDSRSPIGVEDKLHGNDRIRSKKSFSTACYLLRTGDNQFYFNIWKS